MMLEEEVDDYAYSQIMFPNGVDEELLRDSNGMFNIGSVGIGNFLLESDAIVTASDDPLLPLPPSSEARGQLFGLSFTDSEFEMSPNFLQHLAAADSDGSINSSMDLVGSNTKQNVVARLGADDIKNSNDSVNNFPRAGTSTAISGGCGGSEYGSTTTMGPTKILIPEEEVVIRDNWGGPYNFKVKPLLDEEKVVKKKAQYSDDHNKLFCNVSTAVKFKFEMDFDNIVHLDQLMVRAYLVYEDSDAVSRPVLRCLACIQTESKITEEAKKERLVHMLRPSDAKTDIMYFQNEASKRCCLLMPLRHPEPGMTYVTRSFCFTCRNSFHMIDMDGKSRRAIAVMFYLFEKGSGKVVGSYTNVRVCSAPARDYGKEVSSRTKTSSVVTVRKSDDDGVSSSQETVYSCDESEHRIQLRDLIHDLRWVLKLKHSDNASLRQYSNHVFSTLKLTQDLCTSARRLDQELRQAAEEEKSPDGGFHHVGQD